MTELPGWAQRAIEDSRREDDVCTVVAAINSKWRPAEVAARFGSDARRVDRMVRAVQQVLSSSPAAVAGSMDAMLLWARRQWPANQTDPLRGAWQVAATTDHPHDLAPSQRAEAYLRWLLNVRQRARAAKETGIEAGSGRDGASSQEAGR
ncbi:MAG: hypothetical protein ACRDZ8_00190 [Acidimicrobiales bacterium]